MDGTLISTTLPLVQSDSLACLIGLILGDGHIQLFPRTERLTLSLNTKYPDLVVYSCNLTLDIFHKKATPNKMTGINCIRISIYQQNISKRLGIISGNRSKDIIGVPEWIFERKSYIISCLKGLFEAEGSLSVHVPTGTYNFQFRNKSAKLLHDVQRGLIELGFHPEIRPTAIRLRRKLEVEKFQNLISFRKF